MAKRAPALTDQQMRFCEEYCKDRNQVRAALTAGLSGSYFAAAQQARQLLKKPQIRAAVKEIFRVQARRLKTEVPDVVREWAILGKSDLTDYVVDADGRVGVAPGVPRSALRAVKKVKQTRTERLVGERLTVEVRTEIELHGKDGALVKLYEHLHGVVPGDKSGDAAGVLSAIDAYLAARQPQPAGDGDAPGDGPPQPAVGGEPGSAGARVRE